MYFFVMLKSIKPANLDILVGLTELSSFLSGLDVGMFGPGCMGSIDK